MLPWGGLLEMEMFLLSIQKCLYIENAVQIVGKDPKGTLKACFADTCYLASYHRINVHLEWFVNTTWKAFTLRFVTNR